MATFLCGPILRARYDKVALKSTAETRGGIAAVIGSKRALSRVLAAMCATAPLLGDPIGEGGRR